MSALQREDIAHVILTRFNLATPGRESELRNRPGWLEDRFALFERFCLPSVAAQTKREFTWLVFFDEGTPELFRERIERCRKAFPFVPIFTGLFDGRGWARSVREQLGERDGWLLTTRLDNDDGLAVDYCERLRNAIDAPRICALNFTNGFILANGRVYAHRHRSNAFASYLEPFDEDMRTIFAIQHMQLGRTVEVLQVDGPGSWLQVIHEHNVSNRVRGYRVGASTARPRFPPGMLGVIHEDTLSRYLDNLLLWPARRGRDAAITVLKTIVQH